MAAEHGLLYVGDAPFDSSKTGQILPAPLRAHSDGDVSSLREVSRIDYGQVHTIDHSTEVRPLGTVDSASISLMIEQFLNIFTRDLTSFGPLTQYTETDITSMSTRSGTVVQNGATSNETPRTLERFSQEHDGDRASGALAAREQLALAATRHDERHNSTYQLPVISHEPPAALFQLIDTASWGWESAGYSPKDAQSLATEYVLRHLRELGLPSHVNVEQRAATADTARISALSAAPSEDRAVSVTTSAGRSIVHLVEQLDALLSRNKDSLDVPTFAWDFLAECLEAMVAIKNDKGARAAMDTNRNLQSLRQRLREGRMLLETEGLPKITAQTEKGSDRTMSF